MVTRKKLSPVLLLLMLQTIALGETSYLTSSGVPCEEKVISDIVKEFMSAAYSHFFRSIRATGGWDRTRFPIDAGDVPNKDLIFSKKANRSFIALLTLIYNDTGILHSTFSFKIEERGYLTSHIYSY